MVREKTKFASFSINRDWDKQERESVFFLSVRVIGGEGRDWGCIESDKKKVGMSSADEYGWMIFE
jgi:hypothetical protein